MKYDLDYYEKMLREYSGTGEKISKIRWNWIDECNPRTVLDYGSGVGWFRAWRPKGVEVYSYDIAEYPQTGIDLMMYDVACFWDVLEHVDWENNPDKKIEDILSKTKYIAITVPVLPKGQDQRTWKHTKKKEHLTRFNNIENVIGFFKKRKFKCLKIGTPEIPPREDIFSFLFIRDDYYEEEKKIY